MHVFSMVSKLWWNLVPSRPVTFGSICYDVLVMFWRHVGDFQAMFGWWASYVFAMCFGYTWQCFDYVLVVFWGCFGDVYYLPPLFNSFNQMYSADRPMHDRRSRVNWLSKTRSGARRSERALPNGRGQSRETFTAQQPDQSWMGHSRQHKRRLEIQKEFWVYQERG